MTSNTLKLITPREIFPAKDKKFIFSGNHLTKQAQEACEKLFINPESLKPKYAL